jgi:hypothetical protein
MSSHHYRLLTVLFLIASIFGLGAIAVKMEYSGMDSTTLMAYVGGVALAGVILYGFRHPIWAGLRRLGGVYERLEGGDYAALPEGHYDDDDKEWDEETGDQSQDSELPALPLAPNCPLPFQSALTHELFLEHPATGGRRRTVALRKTLELLAERNVPFLLFTMNPSYVTLLSECSNGWLAGNPAAKATAPKLALGRYATVTVQNAPRFADKAMEIGAQVVLNLASYDETEAVAIVSTVLAALRTRARQKGPVACILAFADAHNWLPDDTMLLEERAGLGEDLKMAKKVREQIHDLMSTDEITGLFVYLATPSLYHIDLRAPRNCRLWLLNLPYSRLSPGDIAFVCYSTGLPEEDLVRLEQNTILVDVESRQAMEIQLYPHQTAHEEPRVQTDDLSELSELAGEGAGLGEL